MRAPRLGWGWAVACLGLALATGARLPGEPGRRVAGLTVTFVSLCVEALPFLLAGALIASALEGRMGQAALRVAARHPVLGTALAPFTGLVLPLCDCGLVPLARRLERSGASAGTVNSFVAGAALTNPIVIVSSLLAFPGQPWMAGGRLVVGVGVAWLAGLLMTAPRPQPDQGIQAHDCADEACAHKGVAARVSDEMLRAGPALVIGALLAACVKAVVPPSALVAVADQPLLAAGGMMILAFIMSVCSQADAFVAASLPVGTLPRLAFLTLGPVLDLKLAMVYRSVFGTRWVLALAAVTVPAVLVLCTAWVTWGPA